MPARRDLEFARRLAKAWNALEGAESRRISQAEMGERVAAVARRGRDYLQPAVSKWLKGTRPEDPVIRALAVVLGCDEAWLLRGADDERPRRRVVGGRR